MGVSRVVGAGRVLLSLVMFACAVRLGQAQATTPVKSCPISFKWFTPDSISTRIQNTSGKTIVGLTFYAALADATEHWKWFHYQFDDTRPLREFGWNKEIKPDASKTLSWGAEMNFYHGGGGIFVLASALYSDGTMWDDTSNLNGCSTLWLDTHKKAFARAVILPPRP